jgi:hypothetical protein
MPTLAFQAWSTNTNLAPTFFSATFNNATVGEYTSGSDSIFRFDPNGASSYSHNNLGDLPDGLSIYQSVYDGQFRLWFYGTPTTAGVYDMQVRASTEWGSTDSPIVQWTILSVDLQKTKLGVSGFPRAYDYDLFPKTEVSYGELQAQAATISGAGDLIADKTGTGALQAGASTVSGAGSPSEPANGWYTDGWFISPTYGSGWYAPAPVNIYGTGDLQAQSATISGDGNFLISGTGDLQAATVTVNGVGVHGITGTGALQSADAVILGTGIGEVSGSGTFIAQPASIDGIGSYGFIVTTVTLQAESATISGTGLVSSVLTGTGALVAQAASISGTGARLVDGTGDLQARLSSINGVGSRGIGATGSIDSEAATISADGFVVPAGTDIAGYGSLVSVGSLIEGFGDLVPADSEAPVAPYVMTVDVLYKIPELTRLSSNGVDVDYIQKTIEITHE